MYDLRFLGATALVLAWWAGMTTGGALGKTMLPIVWLVVTLSVGVGWCP